MEVDFRLHDTTAKHLTPQGRQAYGLKKSALMEADVSQSQADQALDAYFWQCFEDDDEDEGEDTS